MRKLYGIIGAIILALALGGCGTLQGMSEPLHGDQAATTEAPAMRNARVAVDEANASLTALNKVIGDNAETGVWTKAQAQGYLNDSKAYGKKVDAARELLRGGLLVDAKSQAEAVKALILVLHKRVADAARKEN